jgi:glycosyltransferase involved in cell wall biosynthesis
MFFGDLEYNVLCQLYDASSTFLHLAYLDHCPNVVVDAQAHGCHVVCSSTGGTQEIIYDGTIVQEDVWDFSPTALYKPPKMNFNSKIIVKSIL